MAELDATLKPRLRGVTHQWAFFVAVAAGAALVVQAPDAEARVALGIYALTVCGLFGVSAVYHRVNWRTPEARRRIRRLDHSMIFVFIAGTYTPFAVLVFEGDLATAIGITVWAGALAGVVLKLVWIDAPRWLISATYIALGWVAAAATPQMLDKLGLTATLLVGAGGILYTAGAVVYATQRPDPVPTVFGYHEVFHALVIAAAALQFAVIAIYVL